MKKSTIKTILMISIAYLAVIAVLIIIYSNKIKKLEDGTEEQVWRVVAKDDLPAGTEITEDRVKKVAVQNVLKADNLIYKLFPDERIDETGAEVTSPINDGLWAVGKVTTQTIYKEEYLSANKLSEKKSYYNGNERLYAIPFDATTTGGYNVYCGEYVDICVLYSETSGSGKGPFDNGYQNLTENKMIDVVLAKRMVEDIRDDTGMSVKVNSATQPGYICFRLTYEEINRIELAKKQGSLFIGKMNNPDSDPHEETFMVSNQLPSFEAKEENAVVVEPVTTNNESGLNMALGY